MVEVAGKLIRKNELSWYGCIEKRRNRTSQ